MHVPPTLARDDVVEAGELAGAVAVLVLQDLARNIARIGRSRKIASVCHRFSPRRGSLGLGPGSLGCRLQRLSSSLGPLSCGPRLGGLQPGLLGGHRLAVPGQSLGSAAGQFGRSGRKPRSFGAVFGGRFQFGSGSRGSQICCTNRGRICRRGGRCQHAFSGGYPLTRWTAESNNRGRNDECCEADPRDGVLHHSTHGTAPCHSPLSKRNLPETSCATGLVTKARRRPPPASRSPEQQSETALSDAE